MPYQRTKKVIRRLIMFRRLLFVMFLISAVAVLITSSGSLDISLRENESWKDYVPEQPIVEISAHKTDPGIMIVKAIDGKYGKVFLDSTVSASLEYVSVLPGGVIYNIINGDFSGSDIILILVHIYSTLGILITITVFLLKCRAELYSYTTLFTGGIAIFQLFLVIGINARAVSDILINDIDYRISQLYSSAIHAGNTFMWLTAPIMIVYIIALTASNIRLIRREGHSPANLLGFGMSFFILAGYIISYIIDASLSSGSEAEIRIYNTIISVYNTGFVYLEAMLLSSSVCGLFAARKRSLPDKTHIIILGCAIADDGTPLPLLQARIDRALAFAGLQKEKTGSAPIFVPSGGKGADEIVSEAESMRCYLMQNGVDEKDILLEDRSTNTQENMRFSLEKIRENCSDPRIVFSTSAYHVLRSGIISQEEGLEAEGIGCRTKWYFWPNAYIREFIGLLASKWKLHILGFILFITLFAGINMVIPI